MINYNYKQCIIVRKDIKVTKEDMAIMVADSCILSKDNADLEDVKEWCKKGFQKKVVLKVNGLDDIKQLLIDIENNNLPFAVSLYKNEIFCLCIGPCEIERIDIVTKNLKLY